METLRKAKALKILIYLSRLKISESFQNKIPSLGSYLIERRLFITKRNQSATSSQAPQRLMRKVDTKDTKKTLCQNTLQGCHMCKQSSKFTPCGGFNI